MMAGIEHFTAVLAEYMMKHEKNFYYSNDAKTRAMWMWHMLEESEHKDIAYDVYQLLNGNYALRAAGFFIAFGTILGLIPFSTLFVPVLRQPKDLVTRKFWKDAKRGVALIFSPNDGVFGSTMGQIFDYLRRDFHPNDHDTSEYLEYYKEKLLKEGGAIAPYLVKVLHRRFVAKSMQLQCSEKGHITMMLFGRKNKNQVLTPMQWLQVREVVSGAVLLWSLQNAKLQLSVQILI